MVAKSYADLPFLGEPFCLGGKMYINVQMKNEKVKSVRWYTEKEYEKAFGPIQKKEKEGPYYKPQSEVLGFIKGYITIFCGEEGFNEENEYLKYNREFRYAVPWGWYLPSDLSMPEGKPKDLVPVKLNWTDVGGTDGRLLPIEQVKENVQKVLYTETEGRFIGSIGDRIEVTAEVVKAIPLTNNYGVSTLHNMKDLDGNTYIWITSSKNWAVGSTHHFRGTIKEHRIYQGVAQNILTRCLER